MSAPRTKRQFAGAAADPSQRQITSFFSSSDASLNLIPAGTPRPALPANVQSNLLSVGMRIRKSVPEGYKVGSTSAFKLWTDNTPAATPQTSSAGVKAAFSRELLPFCGINRVGGLATQPESYTDLVGVGIPPLDAVPELTLSQESVETNASSESSRKRFLDDEGAEEPSQTWTHPRGWDGEVSPRSLAPAGWGNARVMAVPHPRMKRPTVKDVDQENMTLDSDFEDADFLVYAAENGMDITTG